MTTADDEDPPTSPIRHQIEGAKIENYSTFLIEPGRPPSRGGNTGAMHQHRMTIEGKVYSWIARGSQQWAFKSDTVSFDYEITPDGYHNVVKDTIVALDKAGEPVVRGDRSWKPKWRTSSGRLPASRREARD